MTEDELQISYATYKKKVTQSIKDFSILDEYTS
jgi:hypothetical protein